VELYDEIRREYEHDAGAAIGVARRERISGLVSAGIAYSGVFGKAQP